MILLLFANQNINPKLFFKEKNLIKLAFLLFLKVHLFDRILKLYIIR